MNCRTPSPLRAGRGAVQDGLTEEVPHILDVCESTEGRARFLVLMLDLPKQGVSLNLA